MAALTSGTVQIASGDVVRLPCDFGNVRQLIVGAAVVSGVLVLATNIASYDVTCAGTGAPTVSRKQLDYKYQVSALFAATTPGNYNAVFTITLDDPDATKIVRTCPITVN